MVHLCPSPPLWSVASFVFHFRMLCSGMSQWFFSGFLIIIFLSFPYLCPVCFCLTSFLSSPSTCNLNFIHPKMFTAVTTTITIYLQEAFWIYFIDAFQSLVLTSISVSQLSITYIAKQFCFCLQFPFLINPSRSVSHPSSYVSSCEYFSPLFYLFPFLLAGEVKITSTLT